MSNRSDNMKRHHAIRTRSVSLLLATAIAALMLTGCRSSKSSTGSTIDYTGSSVSQRIQTLVEQSGEWSEMNVPIKVDIKSPMNISVSGRAYMRRDKDIYVSIRFLGMEMASLYVNTDSVYAQYKLGKVYLAEPIGKILNDASITVADIQDILVGRVFSAGKGSISASQLSSMSIKEGKESWTITPRDKVAGASYAFRLSNKDNTLQALEVTAGDKTVVCQYSDPTETTAGRFMSLSKVATSLMDKQIDAAIRWSFQSIRWEVDKSVKWRQPQGYKRIDGSQLLKILASQQ